MKASIEKEGFEPMTPFGRRSRAAALLAAGGSAWMNELLSQKVTAGYGGGIDCPGNPNTRLQMSVFRATTRSSSPDDFSHD